MGYRPGDLKITRAIFFYVEEIMERSLYYYISQGRMAPRKCAGRCGRCESRSTQGW